MAKFKWEGMDEFERKLSRLGDRAPEYTRKAVYTAAGIVADEIKAGIRGLKITSEKQALANARKGVKSYVTPEQKAGLEASFGVAAFRDDQGYINTKLGFDGYNSVKTKAWPKGQPNAMIARSCERGSTALVRQPFISPAVKRAQKRAETAMEQVLDEEINKIMN